MYASKTDSLIVSNTILNQPGAKNEMGTVFNITHTSSIVSDYSTKAHKTCEFKQCFLGLYSVLLCGRKFA